MAQSGDPTDDLPLHAATAAADVVSLESILFTDELRRRPSRAPSYEAENHALVALAAALAESPQTILQVLADTLLQITHSHSSGVSLLSGDGRSFYWPALAGLWTPHIGGGTPRDFGPCGDVLDLDRPLLMKHWDRRYGYFAKISPPVEEGLLVPFYLDGKAVGTIWVVMHDDRRGFDAEDERLLLGLGKFASTAYQTLKSIDELKFQIGERERAEKVAIDLAQGLETQVRERTGELEARTLDLLAANRDLEREIAERRRAEDELRRSQAFLAEGQRLARMGNFSWRTGAGAVTWSDQLHDVLELDRGTAVTLELIASRVHPDDRGQLDDMVRAARAGAVDFDHELRLRMPDGSVKHLHFIAHGSSDGRGTVEYVGAVQDVTRQRQAEEALAKVRSELAHASRVTSLGALSASIAHEVNQPLSAVSNNANACLGFLSRPDPDLPDVRRALEEIVDDANRASAIIARIRQLVRKAPVARTALGVPDVVAAVSALVRHEAAAQHVAIRTELPDDLPPVLADRVQLQQVLLNLFVNAIDAMRLAEPARRTLTVRAVRVLHDGGPKCLVSVQDAGTGFASHDAEKLFEEFYTTKADGMGMGLAICRSIVESHGGRLWAEPNDGPGATFLFTLPVGDGTPAPGARS